MELFKIGITYARLQILGNILLEMELLISWGSVRETFSTSFQDFSRDTESSKHTKSLISSDPVGDMVRFSRLSDFRAQSQGSI